MYGRIILNLLVKIVCSIIILLILVGVIIIVTILAIFVAPLDIFDFMIKKKMTFLDSLKIIRDELNDWTNEYFEHVANSLFRLWG